MKMEFQFVVLMFNLYTSGFHVAAGIAVWHPIGPLPQFNTEKWCLSEGQTDRQKYMLWSFLEGDNE